MREHQMQKGGLIRWYRVGKTPPKIARLDSAEDRRQDPSTDSGTVPAAKAVEETRVGAAGSTEKKVTVASDGRATSGRRKGQSDKSREPARSMRFGQEPASREFELVMPGPTEIGDF